LIIIQKNIASKENSRPTMLAYKEYSFKRLTSLQVYDLWHCTGIDKR
jgi:hypothetical protein